MIQAFKWIIGVVAIGYIVGCSPFQVPPKIVLDSPGQASPPIENLEPAPGAKHTVTKKLETSEFPVFEDDLDFELLDVAIDRQLLRYKEKDLSGAIRLGDREYSHQLVAQTLEAFKELTATVQDCLAQSSTELNRQGCFAAFNAEIRQNYNVFVPNLEPEDPRYGEEKPAFFTGYYTPTLSGRKRSKGSFKYPIYQRPKSKKFRELTREQIDFKGALAGKNLELFYTKNLYDLYILHVQGGGKVAIKGSSKKRNQYLTYDGTNGKRWSFISRYMMKKGYIDNPSVAAQRKYLNDHPEKSREIFSQCPSYVYFKPTPHPPLGNDGVSLTDRRSIAMDSKIYKFKGMLTFVETRRPEETNDLDWEQYLEGQAPMQDFSRFYLDQDTGGAIRGKARADLYFGESDYARHASEVMKELGSIYFLILKGE